MIKQIIRPIYRFFRSGVYRVRDFVLCSEFAYRMFLRLRWGVRFPPAAQPQRSVVLGALKSQQQWQLALNEMRALHLPRHPDDPKNWDTLAALTQVLAETSSDANVLDAGAELYSNFLPALYSYGYRNLTGINLLFQRTICRGPIRYEPGDITHTRFADGAFDAIGCLSVVEHGVNLPAFFAEMARILKPGGLLVVSTDYWKTPVDTAGKHDFGAPIHVFSRQELESALEVAGQHGFELTVEADLNCNEKAVRWDYHGLQYTYVFLTFRRLTNDALMASNGKAQAVITSTY